MSVPYPPHPPSPSPHEPRNCQQVVAFFCFRFDISTYSTCARLGYDALTDIYCRASHTGDAGRDRGRERERGISSELADMACCELHLAAELALWRESCRSGKQSDGGQRKGGVEFSFLFLLVLSLSSSLSFLSSLS